MLHLEKQQLKWSSLGSFCHAKVMLAGKGEWRRNICPVIHLVLAQTPAVSFLSSAQLHC